jgi:ABC-type amino acid transport substrate-binding protein
MFINVWADQREHDQPRGNGLMLKKMALLLAIVSIVVGMTGCGKKDAKLDEIKKAGKIVLGTSAEYPPYEFHQNVNGKDEIVGFDMEIAKEIAKDLGVQLEIKDMSFDGLLPALTAGKIDFIVAGMTPDEKRKKSVDFTKLYYRAAQGVIVQASDKDKYKTMKDLNGLRIGAQLSSTQEDIAKTQIEKADIKGLGSVADLVMQLKTKKVDAVIVELPVAQAYVSKNPELVISDIKPEEVVGGSAIAVKKNNPSLVKEMDKTIDRLTAANQIEEFVKNASKIMAE